MADQYEGGLDLGERGITNVDVLPAGTNRRAVMGGRMKILACGSGHYCPSHEAIDTYHHYEEDIRLFAEMKFRCYRFFVAWLRTFPTGDEEQSNEKGLNPYEKLTDAYPECNIKPLVAICYFDVPIYLITKYGSWRNRRLVSFYLNFCRALLTRLKGKVKYWLTFNKIDMLLYLPFMGTGLAFEPGKNETQVKYQVTHHGLLTSAPATKMAHEIISGCTIGCIPAAGNFYPYSYASEDVQVTIERDRDNYFFIDVRSRGEYPSSARKHTEEAEVGLVMGPEDFSVLRENTMGFISLSYYVSCPTDANPELNRQTAGGVMASMRNPYLEMSEWGWQTDPPGPRIAMNSLYDRYQKLLLIVGSGLGAVDTPNENEAIHDDYRIGYSKTHIQAMKDVVNENGVEPLGYTAWGCIDLVNAGIDEMGKRYGSIYVDKDNGGKSTLRHSKKDSPDWHRRVTETNGESLQIQTDAAGRITSSFTGHFPKHIQDALSNVQSTT